MATREQAIELHEQQALARHGTIAPAVDEEASRRSEIARVESIRKRMSVLVGSGLVQLPIWGITTSGRLRSCSN
jgi:hypothetical protein